MQQGAIRSDCAIAFCRTKCERFLSKRINTCAEKINQASREKKQNSILSYSLHDATSKKVGKIQQTKHITKIANASSRPKIAVLFSCQNIQVCEYIPIRLLLIMDRFDYYSYSVSQFCNILYFTHYQANKTIFQQRLLIEAECKNLRSKTIHACKIISL